MATKKTDLVTIDGVMDHKQAIAYFENPGGFQFVPFEEDPDEVAARIAARDLGATSPQDLFGGSASVLHSKDYINKPFRLDGVEWRPSDFDGDGQPFYAVLTITTADGTREVMTTGAAGIMRKAAVAADKGWLPQWVKIVEGNQTSGGYKPLDLTAAPAGVFDSDGKAF
jgi:hypothetical protein